MNIDKSNIENTVYTINRNDYLVEYYFKKEFPNCIITDGYILHLDGTTYTIERERTNCLGIGDIEFYKLKKYDIDDAPIQCVKCGHNGTTALIVLNDQRMCSGCISDLVTKLQHDIIVLENYITYTKTTRN